MKQWTGRMNNNNRGKTHTLMPPIRLEYDKQTLLFVLTIEARLRARLREGRGLYCVVGCVGFYIECAWEECTFRLSLRQTTNFNSIHNQALFTHTHLLHISINKTIANAKHDTDTTWKIRVQFNATSVYFLKIRRKYRTRAVER